jgi:ligand-binding sensor domain-containing protein
VSQRPSISFEHLSTVDGLSHNNVSCILQDRQGYMWFGTEYGLNRYDGYGFRVFKNVPGDFITLAQNLIMSLFENENGFMWISESSSLCRYNPRTETFENYILPAPTGLIHDIKEDENGLLWLAAAAGLFSLSKETHQQVHYTTGALPNYVINKFKEKTRIFLAGY